VPKDSKNRRILIVCDKAYTNGTSAFINDFVNRFWHAPLAHAVGYSDGTVGLISPAEFAALDLSHFKRLDELFSPEPQQLERFKLKCLQ